MLIMGLLLASAGLSMRQSTGLAQSGPVPAAQQNGLGAEVASAGYDLSWWTVDGGGGTLSDASSGYTLSGTAGQPDAANWQGQGYSLAGGFWGGAVVEYLVYLPLVLRGY